MHLEDPELDQRLSRFEAQLDRFSVALHQWQQTQEQQRPADSRNIDQQIRKLETTLEREAGALRRMHEEPLKQLQAHAASLREICAAASFTVAGLDQAESRLAAVQADVHLHLSDLSRNLQAIAADLRGGSSTALSTQTSAAPWPLDRVVELHDELRRASAGPEKSAPGEAAPSGRNIAAETARTTHVLEETGAEAPDETPRRWFAVKFAAAFLVVAALAGAFVWWVDSRLSDAAARAAAAERQAEAATVLANREMSAARQEADRQIAEARQSAQRAETIGGILTAPDLIRFNLSGGETAPRSAAQISWSRTRGLVFSASRLPAAAPQTTYQLWLITAGEPVSAGIFVPDPTGRATLVTEAPVPAVGPVVGAQVTVEPSGGGASPSGPILLARLPG
jgi:hypothetical protein